MRTSYWLVAAALSPLLCISTLAAPKKSTQEERAQIVALSMTYESDVLGPDSKKLATQIVQWWVDVPDLSVNWCANLLTDELPSSKNLAGALTVEALAAAGVFVIQNPDRAKDDRAVWIAGLEGVVRAYRQVLSRDAGLHDPFLDKLSGLQTAGELGKYVDSHSASCH